MRKALIKIREIVDDVKVREIGQVFKGKRSDYRGDAIENVKALIEIGKIAAAALGEDL
jgi:hypothetical protein